MGIKEEFRAFRKLKDATEIVARERARAAKGLLKIGSKFTPPWLTAEIVTPVIYGEMRVDGHSAESIRSAAEKVVYSYEHRNEIEHGDN